MDYLAGMPNKIIFYYTGPCMLDGELLKLSDSFIVSSTKPIKFIR